MLKHRVSNAGMIPNPGGVSSNVSSHTTNVNLHTDSQGTKLGVPKPNTCVPNIHVGVINTNSGAPTEIDDNLPSPPPMDDDILILNASAVNANASAITTHGGLNSHPDAVNTEPDLNSEVATRNTGVNRHSNVLSNTHAGLHALAGVLNANAGLIKQAALSAHTSIPEVNGDTIDSPEHSLKDKREVFSDSELCSSENRLVHSSSGDTDDGGSVSNEEGVRRISEKYDSIGRLIRSASVKSPTFKDIYSAFPDSLPHNKFQEGVTEQDLLQVETFYRGHKTEVFLCACLANLYFGSLRSSMSNHPWKFSCTGIPLMILDSGEHHRARKLYIIIAEKGTGFTLWKEVVSNLTGYKAPSPNFHTLHVSTDHTKLAGLSFDDGKAALNFFNHMYKFTSDPNDDLLKIGRIKKSKSMREKKRKIKLPKKTEISQPCCFVHVTKLDSDHMALDEPESAKDGAVSHHPSLEHITAQRGSVDQSIFGDMSSSMETKLKLTSSGSVSSSLSGGK